MSDRERIIIAAGGTGGHINAALAISEEIDGKTIFFSGKRHLDYKLFKSKRCFHLNVLPLRFGKPHLLVKSILFNSYTLFWSMLFFIRNRPRYVVGAGGYVCGPVLLAAFLLRIPVFILEQNAVMGLTNSILAKISKKVFIHFSNTLGIDEDFRNKVAVVGNPIRKEIKEKLESLSYEQSGDRVKVLVFGGSLGALQINLLIKEFCRTYEGKKVSIRHQVGKSKEIQVQATDQVEYNQYEYLDNIADHYSWADLIICRSGASTIAELRVIQKPTILIPYPHATDNHQFFNAKFFQEEAHFPVKILDQNKDIPELLEEFKGYINLFKPARNEPVPTSNSAQSLIKEIKLCLE